MKINIKFFKKENSFKKKDFKFNSNLYWKIFVGGTFFAILYIFYFGYNLFTQINRETVLPVTSASTRAPMVNQDRITKALDVFSAREKTSESIINSPVPVVDPSL